MTDMISNTKKADNYKLAKEAYEKAKRKSGTTLMRWSPDWEQAARYYRDAIKYYRLSGEVNSPELVACYKESGVAHEAANSPHTAAQHYEAAAELLAKTDTARLMDAVALYREASRLYRINGSSDSASKALAKAGEAIGKTDTQAAMNCFVDACTIYEDENRGELSDAVFKRTIIYAVNAQRYDDAIAIMKRQNEIFIQHINTFQSDLYRNYISIIVLRFHTHQYERACTELSEFESVERFSRSNEYLCAQQLIDAYQDGSQDELGKIVKTNTALKYIVSPIATIAKKLKFDSSALFVRAGGQHDDDDADEIDLTGATLDRKAAKAKAKQSATTDEPVLKPSKTVNAQQTKATSVKSQLMAKTAPKRVVDSSDEEDDLGLT